MDPDQIVTAVYKNWRGESSTRRFVPLKLYFGVCEWYPEPQWLLKAYDADRRQERTFAMRGFGQWFRPLSEFDVTTSGASEERVADSTIRGSEP